MQEKIEQFQPGVKAKIPNISLLKLTDTDWLQLIAHAEKHQSVRLTATFILLALSKIKHEDYDKLVATLTVKQQPRAAKALVISQLTSQVKRRCLSQDDEDPSNNPLIIESSPFDSPIKKMGVRVTELTPATPEHGYSEVKRTPDKTKVRLFFSNTQAAFFKKLTPNRPETTLRPEGMANIEDASETKILHALPQLQVARIEAVHFVATLEKLEARHGAQRRIGQNTLMRSSCRNVFEAHGVKVAVKCHGSYYHWSHLIAYFLGGEQSTDNLVPATAASNYNTLELIEQFVADKLRGGTVSNIDIRVEPTYSGESLIPDEVIFHLSWMEANISNLEKIAINPRSYQRITQSMRSSVAFLREKAQIADVDTPVDTNLLNCC